MKNKKIIKVVTSVIVISIAFFAIMYYMKNAAIQETIVRVLNIERTDYELEIVENNMDVLINTGNFKCILTIDENTYNKFDESFLMTLREERRNNDEDYSMLFQDMMKRGRFEWISDEINEENFYLLGCKRRSNTLFETTKKSAVDVYIYVQEIEDEYNVYMYYSE